MNDRTDAPTTGPVTQQSSREARTSRITALVEGEAGALLNYFARRTTTTDDAADLLGETFVVVWRRERIVPEDQVAVRKWLYGVARKVLAGHHRSSRRRHALTERLSAELLTLPTPVANTETSTVRDLLSALPNSSDSSTGMASRSTRPPRSCQCDPEPPAAASAAHVHASAPISTTTPPNGPRTITRRRALKAQRPRLAEVRVLDSPLLDFDEALLPTHP